MNYNVVSTGLNHVRDAARQRLFLNAALVGVGLVVLGYVVGHLSFGVRDRAFRSIAMSGIALTLDASAILIGVRAVAAEVESRRASIFLASGVRRWEFVLGRYLGTITQMSILAIGLETVYLMVLEFSNFDEIAIIQELQVLIGAWAEASLLGAFALMLSCLTSPGIGLGLTLAFGFSCAGIGTVATLTRGTEGALATMITVLESLLPSLDTFDFRSAVLAGEVVDGFVILLAMAVATSYTCLFVSIGVGAFSLKDIR